MGHALAPSRILSSDNRIQSRLDIQPNLDHIVLTVHGMIAHQ